MYVDELHGPQVARSKRVGLQESNWCSNLDLIDPLNTVLITTWIHRHFNHEDQ